MPGHRTYFDLEVFSAGEGNVSNARRSWFKKASHRGNDFSQANILPGFEPHVPIQRQRALLLTASVWVPGFFKDPPNFWSSSYPSQQALPKAVSSGKPAGLTTKKVKFSNNFSKIDVVFGITSTKIQKHHCVFTNKNPKNPVVFEGFLAGAQQKPGWSSSCGLHAQSLHGSLGLDDSRQSTGIPGGLFQVVVSRVC